MKAEAVKFIEQAAIVLKPADVMLKAGLNEDAARAAYLACFHVAQACIFERTKRTLKTHHGVQREFYRLTKEDVRTDQES
jgi:uncharacterized protein (UPF0332 family)